ncbi:helix-turn-helix domain-containing protein [Lacticaseibacillus saniviri]
MLGDKLKQLRGSGRTQEDVAKALGISRAAYSHLENNRNEPDNSMLTKLANYYNVSIDYLLGVNNTPEWATQQDTLDLQAYLNNPEAQNSFNFGGVKLTKEQEEKMQIAITQIFWEQLKNKKNGL